MSRKRKIISVIVVSVFAITLGATMAVATELSPEAIQLSNNNIVLASADGHDGMKSCEKHMKGHGDGKMMSGVDTDGDGKISRQEFMKHHGVMFDENDANKDGFMDQDEMREMMKKMHGYDKSGHDEDKAHSHDDHSHDH